jgi:hypothetical protein
MSKPKHTPGPWRKGNANDCHKIFSHGREIANVVGSTRGRRVSSSHAEAQANARLIAAAPELLEADRHALTAKPCPFVFSGSTMTHSFNDGTMPAPF